MSNPKVQTLVLDAHPLITQHFSTLSRFAEVFYTTPTIFAEIKDENARKNLALWGDSLKVRHPKPESIKRVTEFARLTGDYQVLSANDLHIIALTYELEVELNHGDWRLRKYPGQKLQYQIDASERKKEMNNMTTEVTEGAREGVPLEAPKKKRTRRGGKKARAKREADAALVAASLEAMGNDDVSPNKGIHDPEVQEPSETEVDAALAKLDALSIEDFPKNEEVESLPELQTSHIEQTGKESDELCQEYDEDDDDGEWITEDNLLQEMIKHSGENIVQKEADRSHIKVALATQDFAVQNTSLQLGLNLMNVLSGLRIRRVRNYMLRCHACFTMLPIPKNGAPKHFCPKCGGNTLLRCAVSVDSSTGEIKPHLKKNFEWRVRGDRYTLASPLSKNSQKRYGNKGFVHNKSNKQKEYEEPILREDQKEYQKAIKDDEWLRRQNEKILNDFIGGGSVDNFISPFVAQKYRSSGIKVGKGRFANSSRRK